LKDVTYYVDAVHAMSSKVTSVYYYDKFPQFTEYKVTGVVGNSNKLYTWFDWINISPSPCLYDIVPAGTMLWTTPMLTPIGTVNGIYNTTFNLYSSGLDLNDVWFYGHFFNTIIPLGYLDLTNRDPAGPVPINSFQPSVPAASNFAVPSMCFPRSNGTHLRREVSSGFTLPSAFTMYYSAIRSDHIFTSQSFFYDYSTPTLKIRIDSEGYTVLQIGNDSYYFVKPISDVVITPLPCVHYNDPQAVWVSPYFNKFVANATVNGVTSVVYSALDYPFSSQLQYWYFTTSIVPQYFINSDFLGASVSFFQSGTPPPGVFDVPPQCQNVPLSKKK